MSSLSEPIYISHANPKNMLFSFNYILTFLFGDLGFSNLSTMISNQLKLCCFSLSISPMVRMLSTILGCSVDLLMTSANDIPKVDDFAGFCYLVDFSQKHETFIVFFDFQVSACFVSLQYCTITFLGNLVAILQCSPFSILNNSLLFSFCIISS